MACAGWNSGAEGREMMRRQCVTKAVVSRSGHCREAPCLFAEVGAGGTQDLIEEEEEAEERADSDGEDDDELLLSDFHMQVRGGVIKYLECVHAPDPS